MAPGQGRLWDIAPHLISLLWASLGPVRSVTAEAGLADITHLVLHHENRITSTVTRDSERAHER
jgi:predicted dehydrogenase